MPTSHEAFDSHLEIWKREESMPWQQVRRRVEYSNLLRHTESAGLRILDAGGGNGIGTVPFARNGSQVVVADYSEVMVADGQRLVAELGWKRTIHLLSPAWKTFRALSVARSLTWSFVTT